MFLTIRVRYCQRFFFELGMKPHAQLKKYSGNREHEPCASSYCFFPSLSCHFISIFFWKVGTYFQSKEKQLQNWCFFGSKWAKSHIELWGRDNPPQDLYIHSNDYDCNTMSVMSLLHFLFYLNHPSGLWIMSPLLDLDPAKSLCDEKRDKHCYRILHRSIFFSLGLSNWIKLL